MADALLVNTSKCARKKTKKELRFYEKIPVWICEYHQEVLPYIYRAIGSKHLPFSGITMLHFDSHPDLMAPADLKADSVYDKALLFDVVSIADWILPAVYVGHIKKVIWIKPPWSRQIVDKTMTFHVGRHETEGTIRVSSCEKYFCEDGLYCPLEELENCKELIVVVMTMQFDNLPSSASEDAPLSSNDNLRSSKEDNERQLSHVKCGNCSSAPTRKCNTHKKPSELCGNRGFICGLLSQLEDAYILDIDMDFFSTLNPFQMMFTKEEFEVLRSFYLFPHCKSTLQQDMLQASRKHKQNVDELEATLRFLRQREDDTEPPENVNQSINFEFMEFIKNWKDSYNKPVDYDMVHSAGMTTELPVHITEEPEIIKMLKDLENVLSSLPKPTIITVARSSDDDYTPPQSVEFIQSHLIKCLRNCYKDNIECFLTYEDE